MRLFVAIPLPDRVKSALWEGAGRVKNAGGKGSFVPRENYHLTLAFLGEVEDSAAVQGAMLEVRQTALPLQIGEMGRFRRRGGDILYAGVEGGFPLLALQSQLCDALKKRGFSLEDRPYRPHITLARRLVLSGELPEAPWGAPEFIAEDVSLMETRRGPVSGVFYEELFCAKLQGE